MTATVIKTSGFLKNPKILYSGITISNPTGEYYEGYNGLIFLGKDLNNVQIRVFGGVIKNSSGTPYSIVSTETIDGVKVNTQIISIGGSVSLYVMEEGVTRIDILSNLTQISLPGAQATGYSNPFWIDAEQIKYSNFANAGKVLNVKNLLGTLDLAWFKNNTVFEKIELAGNVDAVGSIMNLANSWETINEMQFYNRKSVTGTMSEFLNALKMKGATSKTVLFRIDGTSIINDVSTVSTSITATFDENGDWTVTNPL